MLTLAFDVETTGLPDFKKPADDPSQPRVCALAAALYDEAGVEVDHVDHVIWPDGWSVPDEVAAIHGLTTDICARTGVPIRVALDGYNGLLARAGMRIAYGLQFDNKMLRSELRRAGLPDGYGSILEKCCQPLATKACRMPPTDKMMAAGRKTFKTPKLIEAMKIIFGEDLPGAHTAIVDVRACARLWFKLNAATVGAVGGGERSEPPRPSGGVDPTLGGVGALDDSII